MSEAGSPSRWELAETPTGTQLTFTHEIHDPFPQDEALSFYEILALLGAGGEAPGCRERGLPGCRGNHAVGNAALRSLGAFSPAWPPSRNT